MSMKLLCVLKIIKCGVLSDSLWIVSLQNLEINHLWAVHVSVHQCAKLLKITLFHRFFVCFVMQLILFNLKTYHIKETVLENFQIQDH